jgi:hypothetical protein
LSIDQLVGLIGGGTGAVGVLSLWLTMILTGKLHTDGEFDRVLDALNIEKAAHAETRKALDASNARADAAVRASELIADALSGKHGDERIYRSGG